MKKTTKRARFRLLSSYLADISKGVLLAMLGLTLSGKSIPTSWVVGGLFFAVCLLGVATALCTGDEDDGT